MKSIPMNARQKLSRFAIPMLLAGVALLLLAGCTHTINNSSQISGSRTARSTQTATGDKAALCRFMSGLDSAVNRANTSAEALAAVAPFATQFDTAVNEAPSEIRPSVEKVTAALRQALNAHTFNTADASSEATGASAYKLDAYCGLK